MYRDLESNDDYGAFLYLSLAVPPRASSLGFCGVGGIPRLSFGAAFAKKQNSSVLTRMLRATSIMMCPSGGCR